MNKYTVYIEKDFCRLGAVDIWANDEEDVKDVFFLLFPHAQQMYSEYALGLEKTVFWANFP